MNSIKEDINQEFPLSGIKPAWPVNEETKTSKVNLTQVMV